VGLVLELGVEVYNLIKVYEGGVKALDNISLTHRGSSVLAVIGPNGAGKTTLMRILAGQLKPTGGVVRVLGFDVVKEFNKLRNYIAYLPQDIRPFFYTQTPLDYIVSYLLMRGYSFGDARRKAREVIDEIGISEYANTPVIRLSGGTVRRMYLAMILAAEDAYAYFLDEALVGLDPRARVIAWSLIRRVARSGKLVIMASHYMDDVSAVADRVIVLSKGRIVADGSVSELIDKVLKGVKRKLIVRGSIDQVKAIANTLNVGNAIARVVGDTVFIYASSEMLSDMIINHIHLKGYNVSIEVAPIGLEDVVIALGDTE
jgi:ABC-2 type transport system ATP-binding protein